MIKTYSELITLPTFESRFEYLKLPGTIGEDTFGLARNLNQVFYRSKEWRDFRNRVISRDNGCDLGMEGHVIFNYKNVIIHHINPITPADILDRSPELFSMENVITTTLKTHNAIHYGFLDFCDRFEYTERTSGDTKLW